MLGSAIHLRMREGTHHPPQPLTLPVVTVSQVTLSQKAHPPTLSNAVKPYPLQLASTHFCCGLRSQVRPAYPSLKETNFQEANGGGGGLKCKQAY